jgi:hypothetical protein
MWPLLASEGGIRPWVYYLVRIGSASLAIVLVGLIVVWTGYIRGEVRAWFVMFVIVCIFAFPAYVLPILLRACRDPELIGWSGWLRAAVSGAGPERDIAKGPLDFLVMLVALLLPVRSFFRRPSETQEPPLPTATGHPGTIE